MLMRIINMSTETDGNDSKQSSVATARHELKPQPLKQMATLLTSASSPSIADSLIKREEKKLDVPKGMKNSSSATSIVSNWIFSPFERLNHTTADFEVYAGSPPEDSSEGPHYFGGSQQNQAQVGDGPRSELISKLMPHVGTPTATQQQSLPMRPSFDNLSQFFDNSSNEPSPNVSPMPSPRASPFLSRRLISPDGTINAPGGLTSKETTPSLCRRNQSTKPEASSSNDRKSVESTSKYPINMDTPKAPLTTACLGSNDKKSKSPQTFKFNVANFDLNAVGPSSWALTL